MNNEGKVLQVRQCVHLESAVIQDSLRALYRGWRNGGTWAEPEKRDLNHKRSL